MSDANLTHETAKRELRPPIIGEGHSPATVTDKIATVITDKTPLWWFGGLGFSLSLLGISLATAGPMASDLPIPEIRPMVTGV